MYKPNPTDVYGSNLFYRALTLILVDALSEQNPEHFQQHYRQYAQEADDDATRWMAENIPPEWQLDPKYATVPKDAGIIMANGIVMAKKRFLESLDIK